MKIAIISYRNRTHHVSQDSINSFENIFARVANAYIFSPSLFSYYAWKISKKFTNMNLHAAILSNVSLRRFNPDALFVPIMTPYYATILDSIEKNILKNTLKVFYFLDVWLPTLNRSREVIKRCKPDFLFCSFKDTVQYFQDLLPDRVEWLPQAVDTSIFYDYGFTKKYYALSIGRYYEPHHRAMIFYAQKQNLNYLFIQYNKVILGPKDVKIRSYLDYAKVVNQSKYFFVSTRNMCQEGCGDISPVTARFYESAAAKAMLIGGKPTNEEFLILFPFKHAVVELKQDGSDLEEKLRYYDSHQNEYNEIVNRNYQYICKHHAWENRVRKVIEILENKFGLK